MDLSSFLAELVAEAQPIYEEIPKWQSEPDSEYVDKTSCYNTLPIESEYSENEQEFFLVPFSGPDRPLVISKYNQVPGRNTNKKIFTFHKNTFRESELVKKREDIKNSNIINHFEFLENFQNVCHQKLYYMW